MNSLLLLILLTLIASINAKINTTSIPETSYLFSFFDADERAGLRMAYSTDGYTFQALNDDKPLLTPKIGDKILRDPCISYGPDNTFHLVYTTSWNSKDIGYAYSKDLVHWSDEQLIPVMHNVSEAQNSWAPEIIYDFDKKHYLIFWSSSVIGKFGATKENKSNRIYSTTTSDFKAFTPTKLHYDGNFSSIDATLLHDIDHKDWLMFIKYEENQLNIRIVVGNTPDGPWGQISSPITGHYKAEGPTAVKVGNYYHVYFDKYTTNQMGLVRSTDLIHWEDMSSHIKFPPKAKHGTVIKVAPDVIRTISKAGL